VRNSQHFPKNDPIASSHPTPKASERLHGRESSVEMASGWNIYLDQFSRSPGRAFADVALDNLLFVPVPGARRPGAVDVGGGTTKALFWLAAMEILARRHGTFSPAQSESVFVSLEARP
jgi:hypothetical protein